MASSNVYLVYGKTGWIGGEIIKLLREQGKTVHLGDARLEDRAAVISEIESIKPTHVMNAAGVTGRPNVDWCDLNKDATIRANVIGTLNIADICHTHNIHLTIFATGCIFEYDKEHVIGGKPFTEEDDGNFDGSFYSLTKGYVEKMLKLAYPKALVLRVRMPISDDLIPRNFVTKISTYKKVINIPNSMTVMTEMLPASIIMADKNLEGVYNFCNPGAISHNEILEMYKKYINPKFTYENFTVEEQDKILLARRSNNELDGTKLMNALPPGTINEIHVAMDACFTRMRAAMEAAGTLPK